MFRLYYLGLAPYERARHFLGLSERGWVNWSEEIRRKCGDGDFTEGDVSAAEVFWWGAVSSEVVICRGGEQLAASR